MGAMYGCMGVGVGVDVDVGGWAVWVRERVCWC